MLFVELILNFLEGGMLLEQMQLSTFLDQTWLEMVIFFAILNVFGLHYDSNGLLCLKLCITILFKFSFQSSLFHK